MLRKIPVTGLFTLISCCSVQVQAQQAVRNDDQLFAVSAEADNQSTIILRRETKKSMPPVDIPVKVADENKPIIIVVPQQTPPSVVIQDQRPNIAPAAVADTDNHDASKNKNIEERPLFFMGIEGGIVDAKYASNSLRNWEYGYRWTGSNAAHASVVRLYTGYNINHLVSAETGVFLTSVVTGSRHIDGAQHNYDTRLRSSGFDFLLRYTSPQGLFIKGGYAFVETVGRSYVEYRPDGVSTGQMRWTYGNESAMNIALGAGLDLPVSASMSLTLTAMHYRTVFSHQRNRINFLMGGIKFAF